MRLPGTVALPASARTVSHTPHHSSLRISMAALRAVSRAILNHLHAQVGHRAHASLLSVIPQHRHLSSEPHVQWITGATLGTSMQEVDKDRWPRVPMAGSVNAAELHKFSQLAGQWWDPHGPFSALQRMNPARCRFIRDAVCRNAGLNPLSFEPLRGLTLLDVGCGGGLLSENLARLGARVYGIDAATDSIHVAVQHAADDVSIAGRWAYSATSAEQLLAAGEQFDAVIASEVVEHVNEPQQFLAVCTGLTRPGGVLVLSTINRTLESLLLAKGAAEYLLRLVPVGTHDWTKFITPEELVMMFRALGAQGISVVLQEVAGLAFNPLSQTWALESNTAVNYIAAFKRLDVNV